MEVLVWPVVRRGLPGGGDGGGGGGVRAVAGRAVGPTDQAAQAATGASGDFVWRTVSTVGREVCLHHDWDQQRNSNFLSGKETEIQEKMFVIIPAISASLLSLTQLISRTVSTEMS